MSEVLVVMSSIMILVSIASGYLLGRRRFLAGLAITVDCFLIGVVGIMTSYSLIQFNLAKAVALLGVFASFILLYFGFNRNVKTLFILPLPVYFLIQGYVYPVPIIALFASYVLLTSFISALEYAETSIVDLVKESSGYSTALLLPFALVQRLVNAFVDKVSRTALAVAYLSLLTLILLIVPLLIAEFSNGFLIPELLLALALAYLFVSDEQYHKAKHRIGGC